MRKILPPALVFAAALAPAQQPAGLLTGVPLPGLQLTSVGTAVGAELMLRVPAEAYRGLGTYVAPSSYRIQGVVVHLADTTSADGEMFDVHCYLEAGTSNRPTILGPQPPGTSAVASVLDLTTPAGVAVHEVTVVFPSPLDVPVGSDLFVSVTFRSPGLRLRALAGTSLQGFVSSFADACGPALPSGGSYLLVHEVPVLTEVSSGVIGWQPAIDLLVDASSGVAITLVDGSSPPTASMFSGLHPDVAAPSNQTARHDTPGYLLLGNGQLPPGSPAFLLASLDPFVGAPWIVLSPGNAVLHLSPSTSFPMSFATADGAGNVLLLFDVPEVAEVRGVSVSTQAFGFDLSTGTIRGGPAVRQRF